MLLKMVTPPGSRELLCSTAVLNYLLWASVELTVSGVAGAVARHHHQQGRCPPPSLRPCLSLVCFTGFLR